jgi:hypothetical protein
VQGRAQLIIADLARWFLSIFPWLIIFCVVGLAAGLAMKGVFKVNI